MSPEALRILTRLGLACWYCRAQDGALVRPPMGGAEFAVPLDELRVCADRGGCLARLRRREREGVSCADAA